MSSTGGPGFVKIEVDDLPDGWEAFSTVDGNRYGSCIPRTYYYCRETSTVQWDRPGAEDAREPYEGTLISGKKPFEKGDNSIPDPPSMIPYDGPLADHNYKASCENPEDVFEPDEEMLQACLDVDLDKLKKSLADGADVSLPNWPWQNTPLHLSNSPPFWDADTIRKERTLRFEITQYLVRMGADMDAENVFHLKAIDMAIMHGYVDCVNFLKDQGCEFGWFGAAFAGDIGRLDALLEEGADIDLKGRYGRTAFMEAHLAGQWRVVAFLAGQGCSREFAHPEGLKFNPGGSAIPRGNVSGNREIQYHRETDPEWFDDMMEKRFPGYMEKMARIPARP